MIFLIIGGLIVLTVMFGGWWALFHKELNSKKYAKNAICPHDKTEMTRIARKDYPNLLTYKCPKCGNWYSYPSPRLLVTPFKYI